MLAAGVLVLVLAGAAVAATQLTGGDGSPAKAKQQTQANHIGSGQKTAAATPVDRGATTVAVLNGTTVQGLAGSVADRLAGAGYVKGTVTNAPDQQRSATQVSYEPGAQKAALDVARLINVGRDAVDPIDAVTAATAGQGAAVVVTVGADQSR